MLYVSTCVSGLSDVVCEMLRADGVRAIRNVYDGLLIYEAAAGFQPPFCNNTFALLDKSSGSIADMLRRVSRGSWRREGDASTAAAAAGAQTFRVVCSDQNQLVGVDNNLLRAAEQRIAATYHMSPNRAKPDVEFWVLRRSEGFTLFMRRITRHMAYEKSLPKGVLHPELCMILNHLSHPTPDDIWLDPFGGSGALALDRARLPYQMIFSHDRDLSYVDVQRQAVKRLRRTPERLYIKQADVAQLPALYERGFVTRIVTDPPWGIYDGSIDITTLYTDMFRAFDHAFGADGRCVLLSAAKEVTDAVWRAVVPQWTLESRYDILVSGKKAAVWVWDVE